MVCLDELLHMLLLPVVWRGLLCSAGLQPGLRCSWPDACPWQRADASVPAAPLQVTRKAAQVEGKLLEEQEQREALHKEVLQLKLIIREVSCTGRACCAACG